MEKRQLAIYAFLLCLVILGILYSVNFNNWDFNDETDNILTGKLMAEGAVPYRDIFSHHPPFPFYIAMTAALTGINGIWIYRLVQLLFFMAILTWLFFSLDKTDPVRNSFLPWMGLIGLGYPIFYGHLVLADQYYAFGISGITILFLFQKRDRLTLNQQMLVSFLNFVIVMSTYCAAYSLAVLFLLYLIKEIIYVIRNGFRQIIGTVRFAVILGIPFLLWLGFMSGTGSIENFVDQTYRFNIKYYSKYTHVPSFDSICRINAKQITTCLKAPCGNSDWINSTIKSTKKSTENSRFEMDRKIDLLRFKRTLIIGNILAVIFLFIRRRMLAGLLYPVLLATLLARGDHALFHAAPYFILSFFSAGFVIMGISRYFVNNLTVEKSRIKNVTAFTIAVLFIGLWFTPLEFLLDNFSEIPPQYRSRIGAESSNLKLISWIVEPGESVLALPYGSSLLLKVDRRPGTRFLYFFPWLGESEKLRSQLITDIMVNRPVLIYLPRGLRVWKKAPFEVYARDVCKVIESEYEPFAAEVEILNSFYIRRDMRETVHRRIENHVGKDIDWTLLNPDHAETSDSKRLPGN